MGNENWFNEYVINGILAKNEFGISEIENIRTLKGFCFNQTHYETVRKLLEDGRIDEIKNLEEAKKSSEYLYIMLFNDQRKKDFAVAIYDSDELWQYPQVIKVYPLKRDLVVM